MTSAGPATAAAEPELSQPTAHADRRAVGPLPLAVGSLAVGLAALLLWALDLGGDEPATPVGLAGAGPLVDLGVPLVALAGRIAAVGTVGTLLFAAVLLHGRGRLRPAAGGAVRAASWWAVAWTVATAVGAVLALSRLVGAPPTELTWSAAGIFVSETGAGRAAVIGVGLTGLVAVAARRCTGVGTARVLLAGAVAALVVPVVLSGHSASADDHVLAVAVLGVHVVATAVWIGGLLALLAHGRGSAELGAAAGRFSRLAAVCLLVTAGSGVLAAWTVLGGGAAVLGALGTGYGWLLAAKTAALVVLAALGWQHRRRTLPRLHAGAPGSFRRFAAGELAVMLGAVALAVALAGSPPPVAADAAPSPAGQAAAGAEPAHDPMAGHDHGELSVAVLIDAERFHVAVPVAAGSRVTVHNSTTEEVTITATDGSFDVVVPGRSLITFEAPAQPGSYPFTSRHSGTFADVLVVH